MLLRDMCKVRRTAVAFHGWVPVEFKKRKQMWMDFYSTNFFTTEMNAEKGEEEKKTTYKQTLFVEKLLSLYICMLIFP